MLRAAAKMPGRSGNSEKGVCAGNLREGCRLLLRAACPVHQHFRVGGHKKCSARLVQSSQSLENDFAQSYGLCSLWRCIVGSCLCISSLPDEILSKIFKKSKICCAKIAGNIKKLRGNTKNFINGASQVLAASVVSTAGRA